MVTPSADKIVKLTERVWVKKIIKQRIDGSMYVRYELKTSDTDDPRTNITQLENNVPESELEETVDAMNSNARMCANTLEDVFFSTVKMAEDKWNAEVGSPSFKERLTFRRTYDIEFTIQDFDYGNISITVSPEINKEHTGEVIDSKEVFVYGVCGRYVSSLEEVSTIVNKVIEEKREKDEMMKEEEELEKLL